MIQMIVHDLKNPLNSIIGFSTIKPNKKYNSYINFSGKRMLNMVEDILDVQKYENKKINMVIEKCNINYLIEKAINDILLLVKERRIDLNNNVGEVHINCDKELMTRVFVNLPDIS